MPRTFTLEYHLFWKDSEQEKEFQKKEPLS